MSGTVSIRLGRCFVGLAGSLEGSNRKMPKADVRIKNNFL